MDIYSTFTKENFNLKMAQWYPSSWDYCQEIPKLQNEVWDCYGKRDLDFSSLMELQGSNTILFVSGIYCYCEQVHKKFKSVCLVIIQSASSDGKWEFHKEKCLVKGGQILDFDTTCPYSEEEALKVFYDSGYEMGSSWFDDDNLAGAKEAYQDYCNNVDGEPNKLSYVDWLIEKSDYQLETSEEQFSEPEFIWSPRDKYSKFLDWNQMENEFYRGSNAAYEDHISLMEKDN